MLTWESLRDTEGCSPGHLVQARRSIGREHPWTAASMGLTSWRRDSAKDVSRVARNAMLTESRQGGHA